MTRSKVVLTLASLVFVTACAGAPVPTVSPTATTPSISAPPSTRSTPTSAPTQSPTQAPTPPPVLEGEAWLVYESYEPDHDVKSIFLARPDGTDAHPIATDVPGEHRGPVWSPDGERIAFVVRYPDDVPPAEIWLSDADGSNAARLFDPAESCPGGAFWPAWSPDGEHLSITCYVTDAATLQVVDIATTDMTMIDSVELPEAFDNPASWSPDGSKLAYDVLRWDPSGEFLDGSLIAVAPTVGGDVRRITDFDSFAAWPDWHPTDDVLAYNTFDLGNMHEVDDVAAAQVFTMNADGTDEQQLTHVGQGPPRFGQARWLADGLSLVATGVHGNPTEWVEIVFVTASTGAIQMIDLAGARADIRPIE